MADHSYHWWGQRGDRVMILFYEEFVEWYVVMVLSLTNYMRVRAVCVGVGVLTSVYMCVCVCVCVCVCTHTHIVKVSAQFQSQDLYETAVTVLRKRTSVGRILALNHRSSRCQAHRLRDAGGEVARIEPFRGRY